MAKVKSSNLLDVLNWAPPNYADWKIYGRKRGTVQRLFDNRYGWHFRLILDDNRVVSRSYAANWTAAFNDLENHYIIDCIAQ